MGILCSTIVESCQHCHPMLYWIENEPGKAPRIAFKALPAEGTMWMSNKLVIVLCRACSTQSL